MSFIFNPFGSNNHHTIHVFFFIKLDMNLTSHVWYILERTYNFSSGSTYNYELFNTADISNIELVEIYILYISNGKDPIIKTDSLLERAKRRKKSVLSRFTYLNRPHSIYWTTDINKPQLNSAGILPPLLRQTWVDHHSCEDLDWSVQRIWVLLEATQRRCRRWQLFWLPNGRT